MGFISTDDKPTMAQRIDYAIHIQRLGGNYSKAIMDSYEMTPQEIERAIKRMEDN